MAKPETVKLMVDGELQDALVRIDGNGEWVCKTTSGRIFSFAPKGLDDKGKEVTYTLAEQVKKHNAANSEKPVFADEVDTTVDEEWENWGKEPDADSGEEAADEVNDVDGD